MTPDTVFDDPRALARLEALDAAGLDALDDGVIGFDAGEVATVRRYNARESRFSGLAPADVLGRPLFTEVAQCLNNHLVAQRYHDAAAAGEPLDAVLGYVLTWRMRPTRVQLRLLASPGASLRWLLLRPVA